MDVGPPGALLDAQPGNKHRCHLLPGSDEQIKIEPGTDNHSNKDYKYGHHCEQQREN
jgi:hypothetical protein